MNIYDSEFSNKDTNRPQLVPGYKIEQYELESPIGKGGMGQVWKAKDLAGNRTVAIKFLPNDYTNNEEALEQVKETFELVHILQHQNLCPIYALQNDRVFGPFIVMKFIKGDTLSKFRRNYIKTHKKIPLEMIANILEPVAHALDYAHKYKILHRDVKPDNILICHDNYKFEPECDIQLIDLGLASQIRSTLSKISKVKFDNSGTKPYMAPEQWRGKRHEMVPATDQYALAVVLYELISGYIPFEADDDFVLYQAVLNEPPSKISDCSEKINQVLLKGLAKESGNRFASCREMIAEFRKALNVETTAESTKEKNVPEVDSEESSNIHTDSNNSGQIMVVPSGMYPTIMQAMKKASPGSRILVKPGIYPENIILSNGVTLEGENFETCIIQNLGGQIPVINCSNITHGLINQLTITGVSGDPEEEDEENDAGILIDNSIVMVTNCKILKHPGSGIVVTGESSKPVIKNNTICENNMNGMLFKEGASGVVEQNDIHSNYLAGIRVLDASSSLIIRQNDLNQNKTHGIDVTDGGKSLIELNRCESNLLCGISVEGSETFTRVISNICLRNLYHGIQIRNGSNAEADNNKCNANIQVGFLISGNNTNPKLKNNECQENGYSGIEFNAGAKGNAENNVASKNNYCGITITGQHTSPVISNNTFLQNKSHGIWILDQANCKVSLNDSRLNEASGIHVNGLNTFAELIENKCCDNKFQGIVIDKEASVSAKANTCLQNGQDGILVHGNGTKGNLTDNQCNQNKLRGIEYAAGSQGTAIKNFCQNNGDAGLMIFGENTHPEIKENQVILNTGTGIHVSEKSSPRIINNLCEKNQNSGITVSGSGTKATILSNLCKANEYRGIYVEQQAFAQIKDNTCLDNTWTGIVVKHRYTNCQIIQNKLEGNGYQGIHISEQSSALITDNTVRKNKDGGIKIDGTDTSAMLQNNSVSENSMYQIYKGWGVKVTEK